MKKFYKTFALKNKQRMKTSIFLIFLLLSSASFGLDRNDFLFGEASIGSGDEDKIADIKSNGYIKAYVTSGALIEYLRDGSEYGHVVDQVRIYDIKSKRIFSVYCTYVEREPEQMMRGIEAKLGKIEYVGKYIVRFEVFWKYNLVGYGIVDIKKKAFDFKKVIKQ